jgi:nitrate reductase NapE component
VLQNIELSRFLDVTAEPVNLQLSPLIVFLVLFVVGLGVVVWMLQKVLRAERERASKA